MSEKYNGWNNVDTWRVNLHLYNDENHCNWIESTIEECWNDSQADRKHSREENARALLKQKIQSYLIDLMESSINCDSGLIHDFIQSALNNVDYDELAENYILDYKEENVDYSDDETDF